ncbi:MAG: hypothetical protein DWQ36_10110 [Acidobacteria bacterium]|nr:MAG: hypothetical protein DWQ30_03135 [Acidobacteriota bacterium]REK08408.1 MAG: hypothetical protein DWQ36_10110 [Acidobacteriota bacterium]
MTAESGRPLRGLDRVGFWLLWSSIFALFGIALANGLLALAVLAAVAFVVAGGGVEPARWPRQATPLAWALLAYASCLVLSGAMSLRPAVSMGSVASDLFTLTTLPLVLFWVRSPRDVERLAGAILALGTLASVFGIGQALALGLGDLERRPPSLFSHYMTHSGVLVIALCLALARWSTRDAGSRGLLRGGSGRVAAAALVGLFSVALLLTLTRGAWIAAAAVGFVVLVLRARRLLPFLAVALVLSGLLLSQCAPEYWQRARSITSVDDESNYDRLCMLWAGAEIVRDRPVLGLGPDLVADYYPIYRHPTAPRPVVKHLHNTYVQLAAEAGLATLCAYLLFIGAGCWLAFRLLRRARSASASESEATTGASGDRADWIVFACLLTLGTFSFAGLFEANWRDTEIQRLVLVVLALPVAIARLRENGRDVGSQG